LLAGAAAEREADAKIIARTVEICILQKLGRRWRDCGKIEGWKMELGVVPYIHDRQYSEMIEKPHL
jgi:hypothetical protein